MFINLLKKLRIAEEDLTTYRGMNLSRFNGSRTRPLGYIELMVTCRDESLSRMVKTRFLVLPYKSPYQCIIGRLTLGRLGAVASNVHLKMKFYSLKDEVITILANLESSQRCHYLFLKIDQEAQRSSCPASRDRRGEKAEVNLAELDTRYDPDSSKEEEDDLLAKELNKRIKRIEPDG